MEITHMTTPKLEALREEVRSWLEEELPREYEGIQISSEERDEPWAFYREFWKKQGAKRWIEPGWPWEYGGAEMSPRACRVINEEFRRRRAAHLAGIGGSVGPAILRLGTDEQKRSLLPGMAAGKITWAEGYTEPDAGSDLASLRTRAVKDGDKWVLTGQKTMTTAAHRLNWIIIAARTDPDPEKRHKGISYFLSPTDAPGIELQPLYSLAGGRQNLTFLNEVVVPENRLLGDVNQGWNQIWFGLGGNPIPVFEEDDPGPETEYDPPLTEDTYGAGTWILDQLVQYCRSTWHNGALLSEDPVVRMQLAELAVGTEIGKMMDWEGRCQYGASTHQVVTKEFVPKFAQICMEIVGPLSQIQSGPWSPLADKIEWMYRRSHVVHGGGTPQVRRMVVATRTLGLPR